MTSQITKAVTDHMTNTQRKAARKRASMLWGIPLSRYQNIILIIHIIAYAAGTIVVTCGLLGAYVRHRVSVEEKRPRTLTAEQEDAIVAGLKGHAGEIPHMAVGAVGDLEAQVYAGQFMRLLKAEGVGLSNEALPGKGPYPLTQSAASDADLEIVYDKMPRSEKAALALHDILRRAGLESQLYSSEDHRLASPSLFILSKPRR